MTQISEQHVNQYSRPSDLKITDLRVVHLKGIPMRVAAHPHRHQPGHLRLRRSPRRRQQHLRADAQEPHHGRKSLQRRQDLPQDQAVRPPRAAGRRRLRHRDGPDGPGRQSLRRARLYARGRQVPRQGPLLQRHPLRTRRQGDGQAAQGAHGRRASSSSRWTWASASCSDIPDTLIGFPDTLNSQRDHAPLHRHPDHRTRASTSSASTSTTCAASSATRSPWPSTTSATSGWSRCIRLGQALDQFTLAWYEDMIPGSSPTNTSTLSRPSTRPICTGEDIYLARTSCRCFEARAVSVIHPDLASSGGILETKKIGDMAQEHGVAMAMHMAGSPIAALASVHCAAATENFLVLENHSVDHPEWNELVTGLPNPLIQDGYIAGAGDTGPGLRGRSTKRWCARTSIPTTPATSSPRTVGQGTLARSAVELAKPSASQPEMEPVEKRDSRVDE